MFSTPTVPTTQSDIPMPEVDGSSSLAVTVLVVLPVALLAAVLPCLIWSLVRSKGPLAAGAAVREGR